MRFEKNITLPPGARRFYFQVPVASSLILLTARVVAAGTGALCRVSISNACALRSRCARFLICCNSWPSMAAAPRSMVPARCMRWTVSVAAVFRSISRRPGFTATNAGNTVINWSFGQPRRNSRSITRRLIFASGCHGNRLGSIVGRLQPPPYHKRPTEKRPPVLCPERRRFLRTGVNVSSAPYLFFWLRPMAALGRSVNHQLTIHRCATERHGGRCLQSAKASS